MLHQHASRQCRGDKPAYEPLYLEMIRRLPTIEEMDLNPVLVVLSGDSCECRQRPTCLQRGTIGISGRFDRGESDQADSPDSIMVPYFQSRRGL
jgi:hypothetical protein